MSTPVLGRVGVWSGRLQRVSSERALAQVAEWESMGFPAVWLPESPAGRDVTTFAAVVLGATRRIVVATGIAIIWVRDPVALANASRTLADAFPGRFVLGVGVSHQSTAEARGHRYRHPLGAMQEYLEAMAAAPSDAPLPRDAAPVLVAALGPKMIALAAEFADGVHPFLTTPDHTVRTRAAIGPDKTIAVEQGVVLASDRHAGRQIARENLSRFLAWPNYRNSLRAMGFADDTLEGGGSDALIDALYAIGEPEAIAARVEMHLEAGADHVCVQVVGGDIEAEARVVRAIAPGLLALGAG